MKITNSKLKQIVSESFKKVMNEAGHLYFRDEDGNAHTNSKQTWRGVPGTTYIYHGEWSDPEVWYKGHEINANDLEEYMWEEYKNNCFDNETEPNENDYESWLEKQGTRWIQDTLDEYIYNIDTLNESFHRIIKESIKKTINEWYKEPSERKKVFVYTSIIEGHEAKQIAEEEGLEEEWEGAKLWFEGVVESNEDFELEEMPKYNKFICHMDTIDSDLYYDFGANYYFAVRN